MEKKMFTNVLPHKGKDNQLIDWKNSVGYKIKFIYDDIKGFIIIIGYDGHKLKILYNNEIYFIVANQVKECQIGNILGKINHEYKYKIGDIITDVKSGKLKILKQTRIKDNRNRAIKIYHYKCLICGNEDTISERDLKNKTGCNVCCNHKVLKGYNDIATTNKELFNLLLNKEDGYKYTQGSDKQIDFKCPNCGNIIENKVINMINVRGLSCSKCGDKISYPNKFIFNILQQLLNDNFENEKIFNWSNNKRYDFYFKINNKKYLIEAQGLQHYQKTKIGRGKGRSLQEEQENDRLKKKLALENGIKENNYIIIDCSKSTLEWIEKHILESRLNELFNLSKINWLACHKFACSSLVKQACDYWNSGIHSTIKIGEIMKLHSSTISSYLKQGEKLNWCKYNIKLIRTINNRNNGQKRNKKVICLNNSKVFKSITEACNYYNMKSKGGIVSACKGTYNSCGRDPITSEKLHWMYYEDYLKLNNENK